MNCGIMALGGFLVEREGLPVQLVQEQFPVILRRCLHGPPAEPCEEALCLCTIGQLRQWSGRRATNALFLPDGTQPPEDFQAYASNYIFMEEGVDCAAVLAAVDSFFAELEELHILKRQMLASVAQQFSYQSLLDEMAKHLDGSVALMRAPAELVAASEEPYCFPKLDADAIARVTALAAVMPAEEAVVQKIPIGQEAYLLYFASGEAISGPGFYMLFTMSKTESWFWKERLEILLQAFSVFKEKFYDQAIEKGDINAQFKNLLEGQFGVADGTFILEKAAISDNALFFIAVAELSKCIDNSENSFQHYGRLAKLCRAYAYASVGRRKRFVMLFKRDTSQLFSPEMLNTISAYCQAQQITICYSDAFSDLGQSRDFFNQVEAGLKLSVRQGTDGDCLRCVQIGAKLIFREAASGNSLSHYCAQEILDLERWDRVSEGTLIPTLRAYIRNAQNKSATAAELNISRLTLQQRLDKIESSLPKPLNMYNSLMGLYFSIRCIAEANGH